MAKKSMTFADLERNPGTSAFCYYRYSSDAQKEESIEQQRQAAHQFAKQNGYTICREYEDRAISGAEFERPGLQHMLFEMKKYRPAYLIVWKMDRISRDFHDFFRIDEMLFQMGVEIVTIAESLPKDRTSRLMVQCMTVVNGQYYLETHRTNVLRGLNYNAERALYNGRKILGYVAKPNDKYKVDESTAYIVKKIFTDYVDGKPLQQICNELNQAGLRSVQGNEFKVNSLRNILVNRAYVGIYKWGEHIIEDGFPRLISDELFEAAQKRLDANKRGGKGAAKLLKPETENIADYWLGGYAFCGECGETLQGVSGTSKSGKYDWRR